VDRYRSRTGNPDFGDTFPQAVPDLFPADPTKGFPAIPRTNADLASTNHLQAIANTAGFHFATIEPPFGGEDFQTNLIMPEPTMFLNRKFPVCSIIRPTETKDAATGAREFLTAMGLFKGQSAKFFKVLTELVDAADKARHGNEGGDS
jgi:hypothetical protein